MARSRKRNRGGSSPPPEYRFIAPPRLYRPRSYLWPVDPYLPPVSPSPSASPFASSTARRRTVRPLIRTVLTDTRQVYQARRSPDVPRRAAARRSTRQISPWGPISMDATPPLARDLTCAKRSIRREVLFAIKGTGVGSRSSRRITAESKVRC